MDCYMTKRSFCTLCLLALCTLFSCSGGKIDRIVLSAPFGPLAYPFVHMAENNPGTYELRIWKNPDQLRAMVAGGQADVVALPTNVAAVFHNKGAGIALLDVSVWSVLWIVTADSARTSLDDFRGAKIVMPFRGDMPHIVFATIARARGLNPERDVALQFVATPQDAVQQLITGRVDNAVLAEPDLSILIHRAQSVQVNTAERRRFHRAVDLQKEWARVFNTGERIPIGGTAVTEAALARPGFARSFSGEYSRAVSWCVEHPEDTARMVSRYFESVPAGAIVESMKHVRQESVAAVDARGELETFFGVLYKANPAAVGGKLPGDGFYLDPGSGDNDTR